MNLNDAQEQLRASQRNEAALKDSLTLAETELKSTSEQLRSKSHEADVLHQQSGDLSQHCHSLERTVRELRQELELAQSQLRTTTQQYEVSCQQVAEAQRLELEQKAALRNQQDSYNSVLYRLKSAEEQVEYYSRSVNELKETNRTLLLRIGALEKGEVGYYEQENKELKRKLYENDEAAQLRSSTK